MVSGFLTLFIIWATWTIVYDIFFHPLSKFPGPLLGKITRIPFWVHGITGTQLHYMHALHEKYGNVVRFCPDELSYTDAQAWKDIYCYVKGQPENSKAPGFHLEIGTTPSMMVAPVEAHARARRIFSPGFSDRALKQQEPLFRRYTGFLMSKLHAFDGQPVDMTVMNNLATFDIMAELTFGEPLGLLQHSKYTDWVKNCIETLKVLPFVQMIQHYPTLTKLCGLLEPKWLSESAKSHIKYTSDRVDRRLERGSNQPDLWNLVQNENNDQQLSRGEMHANALIFMLAGTETTATLLTSLIFLLLVNPDKLDALKNEIRSQAIPAQDLTFETLAGFKYLNACIQEGLRVYPPVPVGIPRSISSNRDGGQMVCGQWLPSGTRASVHPYAASHLTANFKDPELFVPERWQGGDAYRNDCRDVSQPFSSGPRNCLGQNMAWHEMRMILGTLVSEFDMELCAESREWGSNRKAYTTWEKVPLLVRLMPVDD
ncbi:hypothetical protein N0V93_002087 [Gnomoniopsis smithogilvyi]|uniref:Cytochrome P450 n=1 Tax=Gnomoniopsis smithogilvyi TaxID=1191159 RepID=A0A9W9D384_9PEZI|nr:hypothetical protein N0V93_002087 [Gnomoniopsis smithogilvyi]